MGKFKRKGVKVALTTAASCKKKKKKKKMSENILIWLSGRAVKTQLQIVLIRLFAALDGHPISFN